MDIDKIKARIELSGLKIRRTQIPDEGEFVQLFVEGGPILHIYRDDRIVPVGRNLELLQGLFLDNADVRRAIEVYMMKTADSHTIYQISAVAYDPFACRALSKEIKKLTDDFFITSETI